MSIIIFDNNTDFLKCIDQLKDYVNSKDEFIELTIKLNGISDVNNEIEFIRKNQLLSFSGFISKSFIKVSLKSSYGFKAVITYVFKSNTKKLYQIFYHNLRMILYLAQN